MTAIVGILNREAIAIAADSAITTIASNKVVNGVNKIFSVSNEPPVALGFYHISTYLGLSWEAVSKDFRDRRTKHESVREYGEDFKAYLTALALRCGDETIYAHWQQLFLSFCNELVQLYQTQSQQTGKLADVETFISQLEIPWSSLAPITENLPSFEEFKLIFDNHIHLSIPPFLPIFKPIFDNPERILFLFYQYIERFPEIGMFTGLFLAGFGTSELFPSIVSFKLIGFLNGKLVMRPDDDKTQSITGVDVARVVTYAQDDVIRTIVEGGSQGIFDWFATQVPLIVNGTKQTLSRQITSVLKDDVVKSQVLAIINNFNSQSFDQGFLQNLGIFVNENYVTPTLQTLGNLPKQDLADLVESWLHLTFLNRRMTGQLESVGGEIDVLLITKGDGLIWVKRKHYFHPEQNYQFFVTKLAAMLSRS